MAESGVTYFRLENDASGARFFFYPDRTAWRIQLRGGELLELGRPLFASALTAWDAGIDFDERLPGGLPTRWNLVRRYDPSPRPVNAVVYQWKRLGDTGRGYLTDVYYTPPRYLFLGQYDGSSPLGTSLSSLLSSFAHHLSFFCVRTPQTRIALAPIWRATPDHRRP